MVGWLGPTGGGWLRPGVVGGGGKVWWMGGSWGLGVVH